MDLQYSLLPRNIYISNTLLSKGKVRPAMCNLLTVAIQHGDYLFLAVSRGGGNFFFGGGGVTQRDPMGCSRKFHTSPMEEISV